MRPCRPTTQTKSGDKESVGDEDEGRRPGEPSGHAWQTHVVVGSQDILGKRRLKCGGGGCVDVVDVFC